MPCARDTLTARRFHFGETALILVTSMLVTAASVSWSFFTKAPCTTNPVDGERPTIFAGDHDLLPCYSDLMTMWHDRGLAEHLFPYVHGGITPDGHLFGGAVEYPVLSGLIMWLSGLGADSDYAFLWHSLLILAPFAFVVTIVLALLTRWWAMLWAATPPLLLYALHNWELPVVCAATVAIGVMAWGASADPVSGLRRWSVRTTTAVAAVPLAIGFSLKIYPGLFVLPVALYALTRGENTRDRERGVDWLGGANVLLVAIATVLVTQVPFMIAGYDGWKAAIDFQSLREANLSTNSIWYWGLRPLMGGETPEYTSIVDIASPALVVVSLLAACALGWRVYRRSGTFPWLGVSGAMLAGFMLFHKVHSPQYTLWILPFFVLLQVRWWWIAAYLVTDVILDFSIFRLLAGHSPAWLINAGMHVGVWTHAAILLVMIVAFITMRPREPLASYLTASIPLPGPLTRLRASDDAAARTWLGAPTLTGDAVTLRPLVPSDAAALAAVAGDPEVYRWTSAIPRSMPDAAAWIRSALTDPRRVPFAVVDADGELVGTTSYYDVDGANRTLAVGYTFYSESVMGTAVNPESKLLLCDYAFADRGAVRVVWHTHERNARSRRAISKLGAVEEGELRKHRRFGDGWRTTAQFAMVDDDWPRARDGLRARLSR